MIEDHSVPSPKISVSQVLLVTCEQVPYEYCFTTTCFPRYILCSTSLISY